MMLEKFITRISRELGEGSSLSRMGLLWLLGLMSSFSFAPFYFLPLLWVSYPVLLFVLFKSKNLFEAFSMGWWFSFGQFFMGTIWISSAFEIDGRYPSWTGYFAAACLAALLAIYYGLATGLLWYLLRNKPLHKNALSIVLSFVVFWTGAELLRGHLFTGFPWNLMGYVWGFSDVMLQNTAVWGIYGLGVVTLFLALIPYLLINLRADPKPFYRVLAAGVLVMGAMMLYGTMQLSEPTKFRDDVKLKIVQSNINQKDKWDQAKRFDNFIKYLDLSRSAPEEGITHVIWPETASIYSLDIEPARRYLIGDMLNDGEILMTGFPRIIRKPEFKAWNSFVIIDSKGNVQNIYDKYHLVPFGEYTPDIFKNTLPFLGLGMLVEGFSYSKGEGIRTLHREGALPVGVLICYEIIFSGDVVDKNDRPDWLLNVTNDAWYGTFSEPYQHLVQTRVRAIEEGLPVIRSAGTGVSAVIDAYGRIVKKLSLNQQGVIVSFLPEKRNDITLFYKDYNLGVYLMMLLLYSLSIFLRGHVKSTGT